MDSPACFATEHQGVHMTSHVPVVIVNWNGAHLLDRCLSALRAQTYGSCQVILVDNGSSDGSVTLVRRSYPKVRVIRNDLNVGFAEANNIAIRATHSDYVATRHGGEPDEDGSGQPEEIFGPCAGAALYRREMLEQVGVFDQDFFAYMEDVDLAWRAQLAGWRCLYVPTARVYHAHSGTAGEGSAFKNRLKGRNSVWTIVKNYPWPQCIHYLPAILLYDLAAIAYTLAVQRDVNPLRGRLEALRGLRTLMLKRRAVQALRVIPSRAMLSRMDPLESPLQVLGRFRHLREMSVGRE